MSAVAADRREQANQTAFARMTGAEPVLVDVQPAGRVVPGMTPQTILTSGPPLPWAGYTGPQRMAVLCGALYEGLADSLEEADERLAAGEIVLEPTHHHGCVGSVAGIYTASMPVFVVENQALGNRAFCNFYEGESRRRLNYGAYGDEVHAGLRLLEEVIAPVIGAAVARSGGIPLLPLMVRALHMGDELHSRNTAATLLFTRELFPALLDLERDLAKEVRRTFEFLRESDYFFLRLSMASAKSMADAAHGVGASSLVTAMTINCRNYAIRVSGLGEQEWFLGPLPEVDAKLFEPFTLDDVAWIGGESHITETVGLGGFAQAAAFALQAYQGGSPQAMAELNSAMYEITVGENTSFKLPYFGYRGTPTGIDLYRVLETGIVPVIDGGLAGKQGGQIGAGVLRAPLECFERAAEAYEAVYGAH